MYPLINIEARAGGPELEEVTFKTEFNGLVNFTLTKSGSAVNWDMGDGTLFINTNTVNHTYTDGTEKTVTIFADDLSLITEFGTLTAKEITEVNFQNLDSLGGSFIASFNPNLTGLNMPTNSATPFTTFWAYNCDLTGALDLSGCIIQGLFRVDANNSLTSILHSSNATQFTTNYRANNCDLTGAHNMQGVKIQSGQFAIQANNSLTALNLNTNISQTSNNFTFNNCDITGALDVSFIEITNDFRAYSNANLTGITHKATATALNIYLAFSTGLTTLDLSMLSNLGGNVKIHACPSLTSITFPTNSATPTTQMHIYSNPLVTSYDLSGFDLGGELFLGQNNALTVVTFRATLGAATLTYTQFYNCSALTSLDFTNLRLSQRILGNNTPNLTSLTFGVNNLAHYLVQIGGNGLTNLDLTNLPFSVSTDFRTESSPNLTTLTLPSDVSGKFLNLDVYDCPNLGVIDFSVMPNCLTLDNADFRLTANAWTAAEVNETLVILDSISLAGNSGRIVHVQTNTAPDGTSGGFDGLTAKANLIIKGFSVTTD